MRDYDTFTEFDEKEGFRTVKVPRKLSKTQILIAIWLSGISTAAIAASVAVTIAMLHLIRFYNEH